MLTVTHRTKRIDGVPVVVVSDKLYLRGRLAERTTDWYSQDKRGNVWYFGEDTAELDRKGRVTSTEGSWQAGRDGAPRRHLHARAPARRPVVPAGVLQRPSRGSLQGAHAARRSHGAVRRRPRNVLLTREWTPLEPGVIDHKYYVRGIGTVLEQTVKGGDERNELVSFRRS